MRLLSTKFVSPEGEKNLVAYKYSGSDKSLLYKHFFSPCAQFLVDHVFPSWLAPNLITLMGFLCTLIPHLIVLIGYTSSDTPYVPNWLCFLAAAGQLMYMILDNADGKQARKTGTSSPLGLLFDHGCDAMNTFISGLTLFKVVLFENTSYVVLAYLVAMTTFFLATWEEYYIDSLNLPIVNGANEGIFFVIILYIISGICGCQIWDHQVGTLKASEIVLIAFAAMAFVTIASNIINVARHDKSKLVGALFNLITIAYLDITMILVNYLTPNVIADYSRVLIYFIGFSFAKLVGHLQVSHVAHENFMQFRKSIFVSCTVLNINAIISGFSNNSSVEDAQTYLLFICFAFALIVYIHFVINIISQFTRVLNIYVFKIGKPESAQDYLLSKV